MRFFRVGDKVISQEKLGEQIEGILRDREGGATQEEAARAHGVQRSFVSWLETLGEVRRGARVALVGFPIANIADVQTCADRHGVEYTFLLTQHDREGLSSAPADQVFNQVLDTLATLKDFDVIVLLASDWRINLIEKILGREVVAVNLGHSPLTHDIDVDLDELDGILAGVTSQERSMVGEKAAKRAAESAKAKAGDLFRPGPGRWARSSRS